MFASVGDRLIIRSRTLDGPVRDGEIIEVGHSDGSPPYLVRWSTGGESLMFPGPDAEIHHVAHSTVP